jgi:hypothetical protein
LGAFSIWAKATEAIKGRKTLMKVSVIFLNIVFDGLTPG